ncbi:hypothetical protein EJ08DRAFT_692932 [Tothia fuscella]|uniref:Uncharacterized protein n=1 Tax=Tothia fuscella TaxID=1048955 RepID=A0A9P4P0J5_9PEZI|nr:hypothetical protein EJ08DRAFT_692932 [Tothia fuscella]
MDGTPGPSPYGPGGFGGAGVFLATTQKSSAHVLTAHWKALRVLLATNTALLATNAALWDHTTDLLAMTNLEPDIQQPHVVTQLSIDAPSVYFAREAQEPGEFIANCKHIYTLLRSQPQEQGWMTLAFHVLFLNFCIDNYGLFKMADRIAQVNTVVVDMLRKVPTDPQDYINALKSVYDEYIKNEPDLRNPDLSGGYMQLSAMYSQPVGRLERTVECNSTSLSQVYRATEATQQSSVADDTDENGDSPALQEL